MAGTECNGAPKAGGTLGGVPGQNNRDIRRQSIGRDRDEITLTFLSGGLF